ncbi:hypothetical protein L2E82_52683 [Cichorium intybus]|nr:hypothetical protein L2E82_52683 [Cichorium intybus]
MKLSGQNQSNKETNLFNKQKRRERDSNPRYMTLAFQLAVFALIATSSILLISVPVVFASPDGWSSNKNVVFSGTSLWIGLVFLVGILNSLIS